MDHRGGGRMFSQRSNEKWSSPLSLAIDADKNFFLIIWYLLDKNERERRVISSASGGGITASVGSINSVETLGRKKKEGFWKWCTVTQPGFRTGCGDFPRKENILLANRILLRKYRTMYATIATVFTIYRRLRMDTRWLVVIACLVTFDLLIGVFSSRLITVRAGETSGGGEEDLSISFELFFQSIQSVGKWRKEIANRVYNSPPLSGSSRQIWAARMSFLSAQFMNLHPDLCD